MCEIVLYFLGIDIADIAQHDFDLLLEEGQILRKDVFLEGSLLAGTLKSFTCLNQFR